jgi:phage baseplate assembly protein gpV
MRREERLDDPEESLRLALENAQSQIWTALPSVVTAVDLSKQTVSVQPSIQGNISAPDGSSQSVNLPLLVDVPIVWPRAGGFALTFPIAAGDEVLVVFASRCIDSWWQSGGVGVQAEVRMHDLSDGFAVLAPTSQPKKLNGVSSSNVQLRDEAGTTYVEIAPGGKIKLLGATSIDINAPTVNIDATNININGTTTQTGAMNMTGQVTQTGGMSIGGVTFGSHKHTGVQTGGGTSGGPTN